MLESDVFRMCVWRYQWTRRMCASWSVCSPAVWWPLSASRLRENSRSVISRRELKSATTPTPTPSWLSSSTDRWRNQKKHFPCPEWEQVYTFLVVTLMLSFSAVQRLIVCLEESLYIHNIRDMKVLHTIRETPPNPSGERQNQSTFFSDFVVAANWDCHLLGILNPSTKEELFSDIRIIIFYLKSFGVSAHRIVCPVHQQWQLLSGLPRQCYNRRSPGVWHSQPGRWQMHHHRFFTVILLPPVFGEAPLTIVGIVSAESG